MQASPEENKTDAREARLSLRKANEEVCFVIIWHKLKFITN